jgi:hypothetical protein
MADIIRMADEANIEIFEEETMRFASLVYAAGAAAEREKCAKKCESYIAAGIGKQWAEKCESYIAAGIGKQWAEKLEKKDYDSLKEAERAAEKAESICRYLRRVLIWKAKERLELETQERLWKERTQKATTLKT